MPTPPDDLAPLREAARLVDRSPATLRRWIRDGVLTAHRGEGTAPENAPVLVSVAELRALVVTAGKTAEPGRPPVGPRAEAVEAPTVAALRAELVEVRHGAAVLRAELAGERATVEALRLALSATDARARDLAAVAEAERARAVGLAAELDALRAAGRLPWWRRLLGVAPTPMITSGTSTGPSSTGEA